MQLQYIGQDPEAVALVGGALPLPEGWTAFDHDEPDEVIASEKLASGLFQAAPQQDTTRARRGAQGPNQSASDASGEEA